MFITKMSLPRRTFLRGMGATLALPLLDAMVPALSALAATGAKPGASSRVRLRAERRHPGSVGAVDGRRGLRAVADAQPARAGARQAARAERPGAAAGRVVRRRQRRPRARDCASWLNGVHPKRTEGAGIQAGTTVDQIAAERARPARRGCRRSSSRSKRRSAASAAATTATPASTSTRSRGARRPRRCRWRSIRASCSIGCSATAATPTSGSRRCAEAGSILDSVQQEAARLQKTLGAGDRTKVDEYLDAVREVEQRIQRAEQQTGELSLRSAGSADRHSRRLRRAREADVRPAGARLSGRHHARDLAARSAASRAAAAFPQIGVAEPHHSLSHHRDDPGADRQEGEDRRVSRAAVRRTSCEKLRRHARRRRLAARSLDDSVRRRARQSQPARAHESAGAARRRRDRHAEDAAATSRIRTTRR